MGLSFDILIFDCLLKAPQPVTGLFFTEWPSSLHFRADVVERISLRVSVSFQNSTLVAWMNCSV